MPSQSGLEMMFRHLRFRDAGVAGSWRNALTPAQVRALMDAHGEVMERFGSLEEAQAFLRG